MELINTIEFMESPDYKERFIAEYWQTKIRYEKLKNFCNRIEVAMRHDTNLPEPPHDCSYDLLKSQQYQMEEYLHILEIRAIIENIDLDDINKCRDATEQEEIEG